MFDWVNLKTHCPNCGRFVEDFQTKDSACNLNVVEIEDIDIFYTNCMHCKVWIEFNRKNRSKRFISLDELKRNFELKKDFEKTSQAKGVKDE